MKGIDFFLQTMKYRAYALTELIRHDAFIAWVLTPDAESNIYWKGYLEQYPDKKNTVASAREYVTLLAEDTGRNRPTEAQSSKMWKAVESSVFINQDTQREENSR